MQRKLIFKNISIFTLSLLLYAIPALSNESVEIAAFLYFDRCFPKQNFCGQINSQFPNISLNLTKKSENDGFSVYSGSITRMQNAFDHTYSQAVTIEKIEPKDGSQIRYNISVIVLDENGIEVIHPYSVNTGRQIDSLNTSITSGVLFDQPEWGSYVRPKFYLGQKFVQPSEQ